MTTFKTAWPGARSKSARSAAALSTRLFSAPLFSPRLFKPRLETTPMRHRDDPQSCIRAALRRRRRALGLTQEAAARLFGMPRLTYHRIETGARHIRFAELAAICELFDCAPGELLQDGQLAAAFSRAADTLLGHAPA
jgi:DNA-binding Xre family transcriptional regulator